MSKEESPSMKPWPESGRAEMSMFESASRPRLCSK